MTKKFALMAALLFGLAGTASATPFLGHDYIVVEAEMISWDDAFAAALPGYHLATISSAEENDFIADLINALPGEEYWLGGSRPPASAPGDDWSWVNGEGLFWDLGAPVGSAYANWNPVEPSGDGPHLGMWADDNRFGFASGTWNDEGSLTWVSGYVLESVPEPGTLALLGIGLIGIGLKRRSKTLRAP